MTKPERSLRSYRTRHLEHHRQAVKQAETGGERLGSTGSPGLTPGPFYSRRSFLFSAILTCGAGFTYWANRDYFSNGHTPKALPQTQEEWFTFHVPWGYPDIEPTIARPAYAFGFNEEKKLVRWIGFKVQLGKIGKTPPKAFDPEFQHQVQGSKLTCDDSEEFECAVLVGHSLVAGAKDASQAIGYFSVRAPQRPQLNQSFFRTLDNQAKRKAKKSPEVYIMLGPIYKEAIYHRSQLVVPSHFFYVLVWKTKTQGYQHEAYLLPQNTKHQQLSKCISTLETIEKEAHFSLFSEPPWPH